MAWRDETEPPFCRRPGRLSDLVCCYVAPTADGFVAVWQVCKKRKGELLLRQGYSGGQNGRW